MSDPVVVNLGGQLSDACHQATCLGRTARYGLSLQPFRYRETVPLRGAVRVVATTVGTDRLT